ncbi:hypothetical protein HZS55_00215 [Halosimplex rubrum]|uniref:GLUG domain-containing protein n=1 Tax=Halosimplex rubrum TaxID=869889 RepID=A0A7D5P2N3_9EURY|nr:hypothetical protein [Halosimplex rubrum]QLH75818.1 hypothetical protein HZS55_00215 [Halosimplex rubrum]
MNRTRAARGLALVALVVVSVVGPTVGLAAANEQQRTTSSPLSEMEGSGTPRDPYVITTVEQLQAMNEDLTAHYALGSDIDASVTETWNAGNGFDPVGGENGAFRGSFDGNGRALSELTIVRPQAANVGLFGLTTGTVQNVSLRDVTVNGNQNIGALAGVNSGSITGSSATGTLRATGSNVGGLVGVNDGQIVASYADASVAGSEVVGGLAGASNGPIRGSYATGTVGATRTAGGLVGANSNAVTASYATATVDVDQVAGGLVGTNSGTIRTSFAASEVDGNATVGGIAGTNGNSIVGQTYWDEGVAEVNDSAGDGAGIGTALSTAELTGEGALSSLDGFDAANIWTTTEEYPVHQWERPAVDPLDQWQVPTPTAAPPTPTQTPTAAPTPSPTPTSSGGAFAVGPGFGPVAVLVAVAALAVLAVRRP